MKQNKDILVKNDVTTSVHDGQVTSINVITLENQTTEYLKHLSIQVKIGGVSGPIKAIVEEKCKSVYPKRTGPFFVGPDGELLNVHNSALAPLECCRLRVTLVYAEIPCSDKGENCIEVRAKSGCSKKECHKEQCLKPICPVKVCQEKDVTYVRTDPCDPPLNVEGDVTVENKPGTILDVEGCVQVENKTGTTLCAEVSNKNDEALEVEGCVHVHNDEDEPLFVEGCVNVSTCECDPLDVVGCVQVENKDGTTLCAEVTNKEDKPLVVEVSNEKLSVCAITEENLDKGLAAHFQTKEFESTQVGQTGPYDSLLTITLDTTECGGDAFYPKTVTFSFCTDADTQAILAESPCDALRNFEIIVGATGETGTVAISFADLACFPGQLTPCNLFALRLFRLTIDLEEVFGSQHLKSDRYPLPNGYQMRLKFVSDVATEDLNPCFSVSGTIRCPQCPTCQFSVAKPECEDKEVEVCSDTTLNVDLEELVTNFEDLTGPISYEWSAEAVVGVTGESTSLQTGQFINDTLVNETDPGEKVDVVYTFRVLSSDGSCVSEPCEVVVTVCPSVEVGITGPTGACCGEEFTLVAGATGGCTGPYTYEWRKGGETGPVVGNEAVLVEIVDCGFTGSSEVTYYVEVTDGSPSACKGSATTELTINSVPECVVTMPEYCVDQSGNFVKAKLIVTCTPDKGTEPFTYGWTGPTGGISMGQGTTMVEVSQPGEYCVLVTDENDCTDEPCFTVPDDCPSDNEDNDSVM